MIVSPGFLAPIEARCERDESKMKAIRGANREGLRIAATANEVDLGSSLPLFLPDAQAETGGVACCRPAFQLGILAHRAFSVQAVSVEAQRAPADQI
jgi:hypothetical protein